MTNNIRSKYSNYNTIDRSVAEKLFTLKKPNFATKLGLDLMLYNAPSPNYSQRGNSEILFLIMHHTASPYTSPFLSLEILTNSNSDNRVSAHFLILRDGTIIYLVEEQYSAWHAGVSAWNRYTEQDPHHQSMTSLNKNSIGIEVENDGIGEQYPLEQSQAIITLSQYLVKAYDIKPYNILAHAEIAPNRKIDPSPQFNWDLLAKHGVGYFPQIQKNFEILLHAQEAGDSVKQLQIQLADWGYCHFEANGVFDDNMIQVVNAFQRRYSAQEYLAQEMDGTTWTAHNQSTLEHLLQMRQDSSYDADHSMPSYTDL